MSEAPFFSVIVATCRPDHPFKHHDWHVLGKIVESCQKQNFKDFELIVVDLMYDYRHDYMEQWREKVDFPILHIIDKDSIYRDLMLTRICSAKNTGLLYARGEFVIFSDDGQDWSVDAFSRLHTWAKAGAGATCRLHRDNGRGPVEIDSRWMAYKMEGTLRTKLVDAEHIGYMGGTLSMVPTKTMVQCNGWDEMFDGSRQLEDSDMAKRLGATGLRMALEGHPKVVEYAMHGCDAQVYRQSIAAKCNGAYIYPLWDENPSRIRANNKLLTDDQLNSFMFGFCWKLGGNGECTVSKDECKGTWNRRALMSIYQDERLVFDLEELRAERSWETVGEDPLISGES